MVCESFFSNDVIFRLLYFPKENRFVLLTDIWNYHNGVFYIYFSLFTSYSVLLNATSAALHRKGCWYMGIYIFLLLQLLLPFDTCGKFTVLRCDQ